jgi:hypothetical protein
MAECEPLSNLDFSTQLATFEKRVLHFSPPRVDLLLYWMRKAKASPDIIYRHSDKALEMLKTVEPNLENLEVFYQNYSYNLWFELGHEAVDYFLPLTEECRRKRIDIPKAYMFLLIYSSRDLTSNAASMEAYLSKRRGILQKFNLREQETFSSICGDITKSVESHLYAWLFDRAQKVHPESSVTKFKQELLDTIIGQVLMRLEGEIYSHTVDTRILPEPVKQMLTWALDLCTSSTQRVNAAFRNLMETVIEYSSRTPQVFLHILFYLDGQKIKKKSFEHAKEVLGVKLPEIYGKWFLLLIEIGQFLELEDEMKTAVLHCCKYSKTGRPDFLKEIDKIRQDHVTKHRRKNAELLKILDNARSHAENAQQQK